MALRIFIGALLAVGLTTGQGRGDEGNTPPTDTMRTADDQQLLIWHLYEAALAGRDIYYDQRYAHNLEMRDVLEEIITHPTGIPAATLQEIERYTKLFWLNTGPYNNLTARKFVLKCTPEAFAAAAQKAVQNGAAIAGAGETLDA